MADVLTAEQRVYCMSRIRGKDTKPEMIVRRLVFAMGYRYRMHVSKLPGCPDLVFHRLHKVIFVHGCFWHRHDCPRGRSFPATRAEFWRAKFAATVRHDEAVLTELRRCGWQTFVVWECEIREPESLIDGLQAFLNEECVGEVDHGH